MSPVNGSCAISSRARWRRSRSGRGARRALFRAGFLTRISQEPGSEFIEGVILAPLHRAATFCYRAELRGRGGIGGKSAARAEVGAERLPDELRAGAVFGLPNPLNFLDHLPWERNGHGGSGSHKQSLVVLDLTLSYSTRGLSTLRSPSGRRRVDS